jgi:hypothetical protein
MNWLTLIGIRILIAFTHRLGIVVCPFISAYRAICPWNPCSPGAPWNEQVCRQLARRRKHRVPKEQ